MKRKVDHIDLNKHLTHQELLEYNKGVLGSEEMYRLELHLNECELCSDALEGIDQMKNAENSIHSINEIIQPLKQQITFPRSYYAIAASITLIAAVGFTVWVLNLGGEDKPLAVNTVEEKSRESMQKEPVKGEIENSLALQDSISVEADEVQPNEAEENTGLYRTKEEQEPTPPPVQATQIAKAENTQSKPISISGQTDSTINMDMEVAVLEETEDSALNDEAVAGNEGNGLAAPAAEERAVTSAMRAKKSDAVAEPVPDQKEPEPIGGMSSYKSYLENNMVYPQAAIDNKVKGNVVLEVTISPNGTIKTITVVKGLGYGCDEEAKRLVNEGPKWKPAAEGGNTIEATQQIKVRFKL